MNKKRRLEWAINNKNTEWNKIIFSDETSIWKGLCKRKRWVDNNNKDDIEKIVKSPLKRHIWGCINSFRYQANLYF